MNPYPVNFNPVLMTVLDVSRQWYRSRVRLISSV